MQKLKKKKINNLLNYQHFLKNNCLKKKKFKLKNILFENQILYQNLDSNIIEFNNYENIYLPFTLIKINEISTIEMQYENQILFNYDLNYNIYYHFNKIMFQNIIEKKNNIIKGRLIGGNRYNKKIFISILGIIFSMKPLNLNNIFNKKKNKKFYYFNRKINHTRLINNYKLKYINFKIDIINHNNLIKKKKIFSRISYIQEILENQKIIQKYKKLQEQKNIQKKNIFKKKSILSRKLNVKEIN
nr:ymf99 [Nothophytophthora sp.]